MENRIQNDHKLCGLEIYRVSGASHMLVMFQNIRSVSKIVFFLSVTEVYIRSIEISSIKATCRSFQDA